MHFPVINFGFTWVLLSPILQMIKLRKLIMLRTVRWAQDQIGARSQICWLLVLNYNCDQSALTGPSPIPSPTEWFLLGSSLLSQMFSHSPHLSIIPPALCSDSFTQICCANRRLYEANMSRSERWGIELRWCHKFKKKTHIQSTGRSTLKWGIFQPFGNKGQ